MRGVRSVDAEARGVLGLELERLLELLQAPSSPVSRARPAMSRPMMPLCGMWG